MNRYTKLIKSLKEDAPTNSMSGVYSLNAPGHRVGPKDKRNFIPILMVILQMVSQELQETPSTYGEGYWDGGSDGPFSGSRRLSGLSFRW